MTSFELSCAVGNISSKYILEAEQFFQEKYHRISTRKVLIFAAILAAVLSLCAFTYAVFSTMAGDNLIITANYAGNGVVLAEVQNQSDRDLKLEPKVRLLYYSNHEPVPQTGSDPVITGLMIPANGSQTVRIDLRGSYNISELEKLTNDLICIKVTNQNFHIGQTWTCVLTFRPQAGDYVPQYITTGDTARTAKVLPSLKAYFENFTPDLFARWADVPDYLQLVEQELSQVEGNIIVPVDPFFYWDLEEYPTLVQSSCFDGYNKLLGRTDMEKIKHISIAVPRLLDGEKLDGVQEIPIFYLWTFMKSEIQSPDDLAFLRGNLLTFREMEAYKVYEDAEYVIYEMHHLVYSDLRNYVEEMIIQNDSIYFNEDIWERIHSFYETFSDREILGNSIKSLEERTDPVPMTMDDVYTLSQKGTQISFSDLKPYSRIWQDIDYEKGYGISFRIDSDYEFFYALEPNGIFKGYYLYHNPSGDRIDIRYEDPEDFVNAHGLPQPRCECEDTENGDHGWHLTLDWLINMDKDVIISYISHVCSYRIEESESTIYYYPLDNEKYHVEIDWEGHDISDATHGECIYLIHDETGNRCNVRTDDVAAFIEAHN